MPGVLDSTPPSHCLFEGQLVIFFFLNSAFIETAPTAEGHEIILRLENKNKNKND